MSVIIECIKQCIVFIARKKCRAVRARKLSVNEMLELKYLRCRL